MALPGRVDFSSMRVEGPPPPTWETLAPHPTIMAQPTEWGRTPRGFTPHDGHVLMGYGDYNANTGPMAVLGYDMAGEPATLLADVPTEAIDRFRVINGAAYAPYIDPTGPDEGGFASDRSGTWALTTMPEGTMIHAYDVTEVAGKLLICGSIYTNPEHTESAAVVWQEQAEDTWIKVLEEIGAESVVSPRFYGFGETDGLTFVQIWTGPDTFSWTTADGATWTPRTDIPHSIPSNPAFEPPAWPLPEGTTAYCEAGGYAWIGMAGGVVKRTPL